jgi:5-hmdU DNA kinase, helical domain
MKRGVKRFFSYARARHQITLNRAAGMPRLWTKDPILNTYRFTSVFRELDKTTAWFREHVREPLRDRPEVLLATVLFRLLNRIEVGEAIFLHDSLLAESSSFYELVRACGNSVNRRKRVRTAIGNIERAITTFVGDRGPYVTGAYIITSPTGMRKLPGVLSVVEQFALESKWDMQGRKMIRTTQPFSLEAGWDWLKTFPYFGPFHSYEMVTDLRHTALFERAGDIMTWANVGPGCRRGLNRVMGRDKSDHSTKNGQMLEEMRELLAHSQSTEFWPDLGRSRNAAQWPRWEMREVEHTLCEFDKYERVRLGEGRPRGVYR